MSEILVENEHSLVVTSGPSQEEVIQRVQEQIQTKLNAILKRRAKAGTVWKRVQAATYAADIDFLLGLAQKIDQARGFLEARVEELEGKQSVILNAAGEPTRKDGPLIVAP